MPVGRNTNMCYSEMQIRHYRLIANIWLTCLISLGLNTLLHFAVVCHGASCLFYRCSQHMKGRLSINPLLPINKMWMVMQQLSPLSGPVDMTWWKTSLFYTVTNVCNYCCYTTKWFSLSIPITLKDTPVTFYFSLPLVSPNSWQLGNSLA